MDKCILLKIQKETSEDQHRDVEINENSECNFLEVIIKDYKMDDWKESGKQHFVDLEQAVIDLMDTLCVCASKHYYEKNHFVNELFKDLKFDRYINQDMGSWYTEETMWGRNSVIFKVTASGDYDKTINYKKREIKVKKA